MEDIVRHPRYGATPCPSGLKVPESVIRASFWKLGSATIFPETVLRANTSAQNCSVSAREYYVDMLKTCRCCHRSFIFSAREQKHWYETRKFIVDSDCVECIECRRMSRTVKQTLERYSTMSARETRSAEDMMQLVDDATFLIARGTLKNASKIGAIKNAALQAIPQYSGIALLIDAIRSIQPNASDSSSDYSD